MPELPELEALRIRLAPRLEGRLITAATVNPKKGHMLRYPVENFANELPARRIVSLTRRGKHLVFATELGGGGSERWLVITPMLGGRFQIADGAAPVPATEVFTIRVEGRQELRYLDFRDMGRFYWVGNLDQAVRGGGGLGPRPSSWRAWASTWSPSACAGFATSSRTCCATRSFSPGSATPTPMRSCSKRGSCRCGGGHRSSRRKRRRCSPRFLSCCRARSRRSWPTLTTRSRSRIGRSCPCT